MALLEVDNLRVGVGRARAEAVRGVSFALDAGAALGIVGESGCGKSTLINGLLNTLPPGCQVLGGTVRYDGNDMSAASDTEWRNLRRRAIGIVFQDAATALDPLMSIGSQLHEALKVKQGCGRRASHREALRLLEEVGISDPPRRARQFPHELSGGMRQRVMIALALAGDPTLLVADEPTTALDVTIQAQILSLLRDRQLERGMAMIFVSHSLPVVRAVVDDIAVMYAGEIVELSPTESVLQHPLHPYTTALLAANPDIENAQPMSAIPGAPPRPGSEIPGCAFAPRCTRRMARCETEAPQGTSVADTTNVSCWLYARHQEARGD